MHLIRRILASGFWAETEAAVATEYALMIGLIAMAIFGAVTVFGRAVADELFGIAANKLPF